MLFVSRARLTERARNSREVLCGGSALVFGGTIQGVASAFGFAGFSLVTRSKKIGQKPRRVSIVFDPKTHSLCSLAALALPHFGGQFIVRFNIWRSGELLAAKRPFASCGKLRWMSRETCRGTRRDAYDGICRHRQAAIQWPN